MPPYAPDHKPSNVELPKEATASEELMRKQNSDDAYCNDKGRERNAFFYSRDINDKLRKAFQFETPVKWLNFISISLVHIIGFTGSLFLWDHGQVNTILFAFLIGGMGGFGVTAGAHRLWCHRAYKAKLPLRIFLIICFSIAGQNTMFDWVRDHRVHHKFSETDADPHNSKRGFFFSHVGWLMLRKHPEVLKKGQLVDMQDVLDDPVVKFHQKYFLPMKALCCFIIPVAIPMYFFKESFVNTAITQLVFRYLLGLNFTWLVNSLAHIYGGKPYNKNISPVENKLVSFLAMGEGWHNYHHAFPWDYKAAEIGAYSWNLTTFYIDMFAKIGWAYDLRQPSKELVYKTVTRSGDGTHPIFGHEEISPDEDNTPVVKEY